MDAIGQGKSNRGRLEPEFYCHQLGGTLATCRPNQGDRQRKVSL